MNYDNEGDRFERETAKEALGGVEVSPEAEHKLAQLTGEVFDGERYSGH